MTRECARGRPGDARRLAERNGSGKVDPITCYFVRIYGLRMINIDTITVMTANPEALDWAAGILGSDDVTVIRGMREGGSPWLISAGGRRAVLRTGEPEQTPWFANEATALRVAFDGGIPVPEVYGTGRAGDVPLMLLEYLPGISDIPVERDNDRLRALGAVAARINAIEPPAGLPERDHPIPETDFAALRREQGTTRLLVEAEETAARARPSDEPAVFVHGDLWQGNTLWDTGKLTAVVDWDMAGAGPAGIDLGSLRLDAAFAFGLDAIDEVLVGWEDAAGRPAANVAYWDLVAGLATPTDMAWFPSAFADQGRPDLDRRTLTERRDEFLRQALARLA